MLLYCASIYFEKLFHSRKQSVHSLVYTIISQCECQCKVRQVAADRTTAEICLIEISEQEQQQQEEEKREEGVADHSDR